MKKRRGRRQCVVRSFRLIAEPLECRNLLATIVVDSLADETDGSISDGDISLRDAILLSNDGDAITFDASLDGGTVLLTLGELHIKTSISVSASTLRQGITIDASGNDPTPSIDNGDGSRVFNIGHEVQLNKLTITGGDVFGSGGGVRTAEQLIVVDSVISGNSATGSGGGIWGPAAIHSSSVVNNKTDRYGGGFYATAPDRTSVTSSHFSGNIAGRRGGGISVRGGHLAINSSNVSGNTARDGGGVFVEQGSLGITGSLVSNNAASGDGGGVSAEGLDGFSIPVTVNESTFSSNSASNRGGAFYGMGDTDFSVRHSTVTGNTALEGGLFYDLPYYNYKSHNGRISTSASIITGNEAQEGSNGILRPRFAFEPEFSFHKSFVSDNSGIDLPEAPIGQPDENGNIIGGSLNGVIDPLLTPLGQFGGPTMTHALLPGSPALDFVDPTGDESEFDQRGSPFARVAGERSDAGAFESQVSAIDFDDDGSLGCSDIDALVDAAVANDREELDLTGDMDVDRSDIDVWLTLAGLQELATNLPFPAGDTNLDGKVNASDLNDVGVHWQQGGAGWCGGDFNADNIVDASDLNILAVNWLRDDSAAAARSIRIPRAAFGTTSDSKRDNITPPAATGATFTTPLKHDFIMNRRCRVQQKFKPVAPAEIRTLDIGDSALKWISWRLPDELFSIRRRGVRAEYR